MSPNIILIATLPYIYQTVIFAVYVVYCRLISLPVQIGIHTDYCLSHTIPDKGIAKIVSRIPQHN